MEDHERFKQGSSTIREYNREDFGLTWRVAGHDVWAEGVVTNFWVTKDMDEWKELLMIRVNPWKRSPFPRPWLNFWRLIPSCFQLWIRLVLCAWGKMLLPMTLDGWVSWERINEQPEKWDIQRLVWKRNPRAHFSRTAAWTD